MGNQESVTEDEEEVIPRNTSIDGNTENASMDRETDVTLQDALGIRIEDLNYRELNVEESDEEQQLSGYSEDDSDESAEPSALLSTESAISRVRPFFAVVSFVLTYSVYTSELTIKLTGSTNIPGKGQGGASEYQFTMAILSDGSKEFESKIHGGPNPKFNETWNIVIPKNRLLSSVLHCCLFGCAELEKTILLGEGFIPLEGIQLRTPNPISVRLFPKDTPIFMLTMKKDTVDGGTEQKLQPDDWTAATSHPLSKPAAETLAPKEKQMKKYQTLHSELLLSVSYSSTTGKLECAVLKAHGIHLPYKLSEAPNSFVQVQVVSRDGSALSVGKSKIVKRSYTPSFEETFVFSVHPGQIGEVTLVINVYHKKTTGRKTKLGWLSMGLENVSSVQKQHWDEILSSRGQRVARWHSLVDPT
ncbi:unnamed protein product [Dicrocoelium dendriticum]|nr:unnamed protein product [Dicrocoelium dendriticum]